ncbi:MAG: RHS repeat-associated core domain-containing protein [Acidobacteria bacterium]|nr:RHS repeat-associated core domain-containing protein [Acidobacteriota bacterium]MDA1236752.1 RHS repeat-associated core domain-containing protein [Acidobacteriota bacterium]
MAYPSGTKTVAYSYDRAGRPVTVGLGSVGAQQYLEAASYAPHGAPATMTLGNCLVEATIYNNRLQPTQIQVGSLMTLGFGYDPTGTPDNNGNVMSQTITAPGGVFSQTYAYDALNRIESATEGSTWTRAYHYDRYGNRGVQGDVGSPSPAPLCAIATAPGCNSGAVAYAATNRFTSTWAEYDDAGNIAQWKDPNAAGARAWSAFYDGENKQRYYCKNTLGTCDGTNADAEYVYDGEGNRVRKIDYGTGAETNYVYDASGRLAAEYSTTGSTTPVGRYFRTTDHLGSTRLVTDDSATPAVISRYDFFPFGEEIPDSYGRRGSVTGYGDSGGFDQLFTAKERDDESGLDYFLARYYSGVLGRFTSADPLLSSGRAGDPQSWNRFAYARNNPLRYVDPTGLDYYDQNGNRIGTDGNQNGDHYVVTDKKEIKQIRKADKNGSLTATGQVSSAVRLPGQAVRTEIGAAVDRSNGPAPGDPTGGFHEECGVFGLDASGNQTAIPAAPGPANTAGVGGAQIDVGMPSDPANANVLQSVQGNYHVHPSGSYPNGQPAFVQTPSRGDKEVASQLGGASTNIVVGAGNKKVYIYDGNGVRATIPLKKFEKIP